MLDLQALIQPLLDDPETVLTTAFPSNAGVHGGMRFYELYHHQFIVSVSLERHGMRDDGPLEIVRFGYRDCDSDEGTVWFDYRSASGVAGQGSDLDLSAIDTDEVWDVEVHTASGVWDLDNTISAVDAAKELHDAIGWGKLIRP